MHGHTSNDCGSDVFLKPEFFIGAICHPPNLHLIRHEGCKPVDSIEILEDHRYDSWARCWTAINDYGTRFGLSERGNETQGGPYHAVCEYDWILERYYDGLHIVPRPCFFDPRWGRIMNPRPFEFAIKWAAQKTREDLNVRIRSMRTREIIPGALFV